MDEQQHQLTMQNHPVLLFDGVCNLCNGTVDFIIRKDRKKQFRFLSLQSEAGVAALEVFPLPEGTDSVILIHKGKMHTESDAALEVARLLPLPWKLAVLFKIIPRPWRNSVYRMIARNRYRWFGKKETCRLPSPEERAYFPDKNEALRLIR
jgi:predicted DCC family thiol-disulfide oxidoreductase YuxK